jgi:hypothetical protein
MDCFIEEIEIIWRNHDPANHRASSAKVKIVASRSSVRSAIYRPSVTDHVCLIFSTS